MTDHEILRIRAARCLAAIPEESLRLMCDAFYPYLTEHFIQIRKEAIEELEALHKASHENDTIPA